MSFRKQTRKVLLLFGALLLLPGSVMAQSSSSSNYRVDQTFFGTGGETDMQSNTYRARGTAGELGIGNTSSLNYQAYAGFNTTDEPYLEFVASDDQIDLGYLSLSVATTTSATFYVRAWLASGYVVQTRSDPPKNAGYTMNALTSQTASSAGTEQFGINLVANTSPTAFGANPQQSPDNTYSFGQASTGYNTTNVYKYVKDDIIAHSDKSTSITIYTVSYLFNISAITPAGQFSFTHDLVVTGTY